MTPGPEPLRTLYVSHSFPLRGDPLSNVGGMQRVATGLHAALAAHPGVRLSSLVLETSWEDTPRRMIPFMAGLLRGIPRAVETQGIQVVLFSSMVTATLALPLRRRLAAHGARLAAIPVGLDVTLPVLPYQWLVPRVLRSLDVVLPISRATARECLARGAPPERVHVIPCGVDTASFSPPADRAAARRELLETLGAAGAIPPGALLLCSVGRHQERKGFHWFVGEVLPRLPADVVYLLGGDGPMTPAIRREVERHGLGDRVRLLGRVSEEMLGKLYRGADLFVMPNVPVVGDIEGFGVVMLEAGLCGLPVLAADLEGIRDVVREGESGHLVPSGDAGAFASLVLRYAGDRDALARASASASRYVADTFSWEAVADHHLRILRSAAPVGERPRSLGSATTP
ncbi:MAG TPA: glycosyltransferase family 4 protein [Longimicrobiaceae bacterium]|nr:glycosyltransferase family 4 protein [Longimicrobiaceae bacterium]